MAFQVLRVPSPLWSVLLLAALLAPALGSVAQVPSTPRDSIDISAADQELTASVDKAAQVQVTVKNTGSTTGTPLDSPRSITLEVTGAPAGWTANIQPSVMSLGPGKSQTATLQIQVGPSGGQSATIVVTARMFPRGASTLPGVGDTVEPEATDSVSVNATRSDSASRQVVEILSGPWIFVILLALLAAVVVATKVIAGNRKVTVALRSGERAAKISPGGRLSIPLQVQNVGRGPDKLILQVSTVADGWAAFLPVPELDLESGRTQEVDLVVIAPAEARIGAKQSVLVTATAGASPRRPATLSFDITVDSPSAATATRRAK